jgi:hypothetical protein
MLETLQSRSRGIAALVISFARLQVERVDKWLVRESNETSKRLPFLYEQSLL